MGRYVIRRLLQLIPVFFGTTFIIFAGVFMLPGDPIRALFGERPPPQALLDQLTERYNLDDPLPVQYGKYIWGIFTQGDFGANFRGRPVLDIVAAAAPVTIKLGLTAFAIELVIGLLAGVMAGLRRGGFFDNVVLICTTLIISIPVFVLAFVSQLTIAGEQEWLGGVEIFPISFGQEQSWPRAYILPAIILASLSLAQLTRLTRTSLVENLRADYVRTARAKGLSRRRVVGVHVLRNSLIPVVTFIGVELGNLMSGAIVTEGIFNIPGVGGRLFQGIRLEDGPLVVTIVSVLVLIYLLSNLLVDLLYAVLDPRIRHE